MYLLHTYNGDKSGKHCVKLVFYQDRVTYGVRRH